MTSELAHRYESVLNQYPRNLFLGDGTALTIAPSSTVDHDSICDYLESIPGREQRLSGGGLSLHAEQSRYAVNGTSSVALLVQHGSRRIVADGVVAWGPGIWGPGIWGPGIRGPGIWATRVGRLRVFVHPDFRGRGIGEEVVRELLDLARAFDLQKVSAECAADLSGLINLLRKLNFAEAARIPESVRNQFGEPHEVVLLMHDLN